MSAPLTCPLISGGSESAEEGRWSRDRSLEALSTVLVRGGGSTTSFCVETGGPARPTRTPLSVNHDLERISSAGASLD